jgi:hypothetical protein
MIYRIALLALVTFRATATTMIAISTDREALLALDSKQTGQRDGRVIREASACKIVTKGKTAFGLAGVVGLGPLDGFAVLQAVATEDLTTSVKLIEAAMISLAEKIAPKLGRGTLKPYLERGEPFITVFAIGFDGEPRLHQVLVFLKPDTAAKAEHTIETNPIVLYAERVDEITKVLPKNWVALPLTPLMNTLMQAGIEANRDDSGEPISIVRVTKEGLTWVQTGTCKNIPVP